MLSVGEDTYVTIAEADTILNYIAFDSAVAYWLALEDNEKEYFLRKACEEIDSLMLIGAKVNRLQKLQFPRHSNSNIEYWKIPEEVKQAQAKNALAMLCKSQNIPYEKGKTLDSKEAERLLKKWLCGSFSFGGGI